ncbi:hypothetical protein ACHAQJ_005248 [Trichoderma viride]
MELLCNRGADLNGRGAGSLCPLLAAIRKGKEQSVRRLLQNGADAYRAETAGRMALHLATESEHSSMVHLLLAYFQTDITEPCDEVNFTPNNGQTALHIAAKLGHFEMERILIEAGADVNAKEGVSRTPLYLAKKHNKKDMQGLLLKNGARVNSRLPDVTVVLHDR